MITNNLPPSKFSQLEKIFFLFILVCLPAFSNGQTMKEEFIWFEGSKGLPPIELDKIHSALDGATWSYAVDCHDQSIENELDNQQLFSCSVNDNSSLTITLNEKGIGQGRIFVSAIARDNTGTLVKEEYYYSIKVRPRTATALSECPDWDCKLYYGLYLGYEGTSVDNISEEGTLRIQYSAYSIVYDWLHMNGDLLQTSLKEQAAVNADCEPSSEVECGIDATIAANIGSFLPRLGSKNNTPGIKHGPFVDYNLQKAENDSEFLRSYYAGWKFAYNKVRYFSIGYGKSERIPGHRFRFSGQLPLYDNRIVAGMTLNVSAGDKPKEMGVASGDSISIYLMTRVDFTKIFTGLKQ